MSARGPSGDRVIGEGEASPEEIAEQLREAAREAMDVAREGAREKETELWARYRELTKGRRERRTR